MEVLPQTSREFGCWHTIFLHVVRRGLAGSATDTNEDLGEIVAIFVASGKLKLPLPISLYKEMCAKLLDVTVWDKETGTLREEAEEDFPFCLDMFQKVLKSAAQGGVEITEEVVYEGLVVMSAFGLYEEILNIFSMMGKEISPSLATDIGVAMYEGKEEGEGVKYSSSQLELHRIIENCVEESLDADFDIIGYSDDDDEDGDGDDDGGDFDGDGDNDVDEGSGDWEGDDSNDNEGGYRSSSVDITAQILSNCSGFGSSNNNGIFKLEYSKLALDCIMSTLATTTTTKTTTTTTKK